MYLEAAPVQGRGHRGHGERTTRVHCSNRDKGKTMHQNNKAACRNKPGVLLAKGKSV